MTDSFPRQHARTRRFTLGVPRNLTIDEPRGRVLFLRSDSGSDPVHHLWSADLSTGEATKLIDARAINTSGEGELSDAERALRERLRESANGITSYALDAAMDQAVFTIDGSLFVANTDDGTAQPIAAEGAVFDPRLSPDGSMIGFVDGQAFVVVRLDGSEVLRLDNPDEPTVSWGSPDFVAAEEMRRLRGFWWAPDSSAVAVCRNDEAPVGVWHIADPANPERTPAAHRYPAAGTANPSVELHVVQIGSGDRTQVAWSRGRAEFEYLPRVSWNAQGLVVVRQTRDQRTVETLLVDAASGSVELLLTDTDADWVELVPGSPQLVAGSDAAPPRLISAADRDGARRLCVDGEPVTPANLQLRSIIRADTNQVWFAGNPVDTPTMQHIYRYDLVTDTVEAHQPIDGMQHAVAGPTTVAVRSEQLVQPGVRWRLSSGAELASVAESPLVEPNVTFLAAGNDGLSIAVLLPTGHDATTQPKLPVLLDPYGGPHAQRVVSSHYAMCASQWFADQRFAVVITDGRGTPGRGATFERSVRHDLADGVLADQIAGLDAAAEQFAVLDLDRVAIRGWSFGGYLAALALLRRPDRFHAAIAGAPVTEWRLYDTHYTERYLGDPNIQPEVYDANSLILDAHRLARPLLLIHGLADDNVVAAHSLQLSSALLAAGKPHEFLPLAGVTHITPQEEIAENLLHHQLDFLQRSLAAPLTE